MKQEKFKADPGKNWLNKIKLKDDLTLAEVLHTELVWVLKTSERPCDAARIISDDLKAKHLNESKCLEITREIYDNFALPPAEVASILVEVIGKVTDEYAPKASDDIHKSGCSIL